MPRTACSSRSSSAATSSRAASKATLPTRPRSSAARSPSRRPFALKRARALKRSRKTSQLRSLPWSRRPNRFLQKQKRPQSVCGLFVCEKIPNAGVRKTAISSSVKFCRMSAGKIAKNLVKSGNNWYNILTLLCADLILHLFLGEIA